MNKYHIKKLISLGVLALIAGAVKLDGAGDLVRVPLHETRSVSPSTLAEANEQCSIFDQTDADIFMQSVDDEREVLFSGCGGFF